jgi:hypothetical protein
MVLNGCSGMPETREFPKHAYLDGSGSGRPWIPDTDGQKEVKVQVLDASTMQPVAGAIVVGGYYGPGRNGWVCGYSESAVSDENGWVTLPNDQDERIRSLSDRYRIFGPVLESAYKRGYKKLPLPLKVAKYRIDVRTENKKEYWEEIWYISQLVLDSELWENNPSWVILPDKYPDGKAALLASRERSTIYLYPSAAKTKEERERELRWITPICSKYPFPWSSSEGGLAAEKAVFQELKDIGYYDGREQIQKNAEKDIARYENSLQRIRQEATKGK